jgi:hypothetical protein
MSHFCVPVVVVGLLAQFPSTPSEVVRSDWYFRESLAAIRDWEAILTWWEGHTLASQRIPVFPVPNSTAATTWCNPIPPQLMPERDRDGGIELRAAAGSVELNRRDPSRSAARWQSVAAGENVAGYKHPGGGGKDQWYHQYHRRFDGLTAFRPQLAPFELRLPQPVDLAPGANELRIELANVTARPITLAVRLRGLAVAKAGTTPVAERLCGSREVTLAARAVEIMALPVELSTVGGGLLLLHLDTAGQAYWVPLFTYVEDVDGVLAGVERLLADGAPDPAARQRLAKLHTRAEAGPNRAGAAWQDLFHDASALRDELLRRRIDFDQLLLVQRKPFYSEQPFMDAHHTYNRPGGGIYRLDPVRPDGRLTPVVASLGRGVYRDITLQALRDSGKAPQIRGSANPKLFTEQMQQGLA